MKGTLSQRKHLSPSPDQQQVGRAVPQLTASREGGGYLQVDPLVQHPLLIELAEEARVGHTEGVACHPAPAAGHATKDIVVQLTQDA